MNLSIELGRRARHLAPHLRPVLRGVVAGKRNRTIAGETGLAVHTIENYVSEILSEFECESEPNDKFGSARFLRKSSQTEEVSP